MIFELFRTFKSPKFFRPAAEKILGTNKGGFLIKWSDPKNDHKKIGEKHDF